MKKDQFQYFYRTYIMDEIKTPTSLRDKYETERQYLYRLLSKLNDAILSLASGNVASYSLGNRSVSYTDLDKIKGLRKETEDRINELKALRSGRSVRNCTTSVFLDPSIILPRKW